MSSEEMEAVLKMAGWDIWCDKLGHWIAERRGHIGYIYQTKEQAINKTWQQLREQTDGQ